MPAQVWCVDVLPENLSHWHRDKQWLLALSLGSVISLGIGLVVALHSDTAQQNATSSTQALHWLIILFAFPLLEEFVFRGLVQPLILRHWPKKISALSVANILTSGLFTLAHTASKGLNWLNLGVFFPSLVFGYFRDRHQTIASAIILHSVYNGCFFLPFIF